MNIYHKLVIHLHPSTRPILLWEALFCRYSNLVRSNTLSSKSSSRRTTSYGRLNFLCPGVGIGNDGGVLCLKRLCNLQDNLTSKCHQQHTLDIHTHSTTLPYDGAYYSCHSTSGRNSLYKFTFHKSISHWGGVHVRIPHILWFWCSIHSSLLGSLCMFRRLFRLCRLRLLILHLDLHYLF